MPDSSELTTLARRQSLKGIEVRFKPHRINRGPYLDPEWQVMEESTRTITDWDLGSYDEAIRISDERNRVLQQKRIGK